MDSVQAVVAREAPGWNVSVTVPDDSYPLAGKAANTLVISLQRPGSGGAQLVLMSHEMYDEAEFTAFLRQHPEMNRFKSAPIKLENSDACRSLLDFLDSHGDLAPQVQANVILLLSSIGAINEVEEAWLLGIVGTPST